jgi:hypothetical protein
MANITNEAPQVKNQREQLSSAVYLGALVLASALLVVMFGSLKFFNEHRFAPTNMGVAGALAQRHPYILFIGSSHTRRTYQIHMVEEGLHQPAFLVAYDGIDLISILQILHQLCTNPASCPRMLVIEAYSAALSKTPDLEDPRYFFDAPPSLKKQIIAEYLKDHRSLDSKLDIFDLIMNRGNEALLTYPINRRILASLSYHGGVSASVPSPGLSQSAFDQLHAADVPDRPNPEQLKAAVKIIDFARSNDIHFVFIESPLPGPVSRDIRIQRLKQAFRNLADSKQAHYFDGDIGFPIDDPSMFADNNHLSTMGRITFTNQIIPILQKEFDLH